MSSSAVSPSSISSSSNIPSDISPSDISSSTISPSAPSPSVLSSSYSIPSTPSPITPSTPSPSTPSSFSPTPSVKSPFTSSPFKPSEYSPRDLPKKKPIVPSPFQKKERKPRKGFLIEVRRKGKFLADKSIFETKEEALAYGGFKVGQTAAATFKVKQVEQEATKRYIGKLSLDRFYGKQERGEQLYIQKSKYRISSLGEKKEITEKGIQASKAKRRTLFN